MKIRLHTDRCIGSGMCAAIAPTVFDQDPDTMLVLPRDLSPSAEKWAAAAAAADCCPVSAIELLE
ncbi:ferredoxin [Solwaraspora sp. WMMA2056]|uniref:ferredoxin n=1 Tax=Solwaraspora sp. WMMA2056 TaxID=3015161 RepID=UPI00259B9A4A|nr:ferredoxin [Solwaraspora sp. WMMA2056]WJK41332.1 ferredoxin [Solwaraspora sp. WMMA2056]